MYGDLKGPRKAFLDIAVCTRFQRENRSEGAADEKAPRQRRAECVPRHSKRPVWLGPGDWLGEWPKIRLGTCRCG